MRRFRRRISLLTARLLTTIVGLMVVVVQLCGEPILLLCIQEANESRTAGTYGDTVVVWIAEEH